MSKIVLFLLFVSLFLSVGLKDEPKKITLQHKEYNEEFYISDKNKLNSKLEIQYHWYKAKEIHTSFGTCEGSPLDGEYKSFYKSNQIRSKGYFDKGVKTDKWIYWDVNGNILKTEEYHLGVLHGRVVVYENNVSINTERYKKGETIKLKQDTITSVAQPSDISITNDSTADTAKISVWQRVTKPFKSGNSKSKKEAKENNEEKEEKKPKKDAKKEEE